LKRTILVLLISLFVSLPAWSAMVATPDVKVVGNQIRYNVTSASGDTGIVCWSVDGYKYWLFKVDTTGTIQYDLRFSEVLVPTGFQSDDLTSAANLTADASYIKTINAPYACINIDSCTTCTVDVDFWGMAF
jgi:hypothetical protein